MHARPNPSGPPLEPSTPAERAEPKQHRHDRSPSDDPCYRSATGSLPGSGAVRESVFVPREIGVS